MRFNRRGVVFYRLDLRPRILHQLTKKKLRLCQDIYDGHWESSPIPGSYGPLLQSLQLQLRFFYIFYCKCRVCAWVVISYCFVLAVYLLPFLPYSSLLAKESDVLENEIYMQQYMYYILGYLVVRCNKNIMNRNLLHLINYIYILQQLINMGQFCWFLLFLLALLSYAASEQIDLDVIGQLVAAVAEKHFPGCLIMFVSTATNSPASSVLLR